MPDLKDRDLVRLYWPAELRPAFDALFAIDDAMGEVVARSSEPALGAIKLAWWRERLEELDEGKVPAEPRLQAAASELLSRGISGEELAKLEESWASLLEEKPVDFMPGMASRGSILFALAARLLGVPMDDELDQASASFVTADLGRKKYIDLVPLELRSYRSRVQRAARPLMALAVLARRDMQTGPPFEPEANPMRAWALIWYRLTGRL